MPVTHGVTGSSPVRTARNSEKFFSEFFLFLPNPAIDLNTLSDDDFDTHIDTLNPTEAIEAISQRRGVEDADQYAHWRKAVLNKQRDAAQRKLNAKHKPFDPSRYNSYPEMKRAEALYNQQISQQQDQARATIDALDKQIADINQYLNRRNTQIAAEREAENPLRNTQQGAESTAIQPSSQPSDTTPISQDSQDTATDRPTTPQPNDNSTTLANVVEQNNKPTLLDVVHTLYSNGKEVASKLFSMHFFDVAPTPKFMQERGLRGDKFTIRYGVIARHLGKDGSHDLSEKDWEQLPQALQNPFAISKLTDKDNSYRIYTTLQTESGEFVVVGVDVKNAGREIEVNAVSTVFGRRNNANLPINEEVIYRSEEITPEQSSLLERPNFAQYPTEQELSESKDTTSSLNNNNSEQKSAHLINEASKNDTPFSPIDTPPVPDENQTGNISSPASDSDNNAKLAHIASWQQAINAPIVVLSDIHEVNNPQARAAIASATLSAQRLPGWFSDGTIYLYLPHCTDTTDIDRTILHECIAHYGVRKLFPSPHSLNRFYDQVWNMMQHDDRQRFLQYPGISNLTGNKARRAAADEYIAHLAEQLHTQGTTITPEQTSIWQRILSFLRNALRQAGINIRITDADINNTLISAYQQLKSQNENRKTEQTVSSSVSSSASHSEDKGGGRRPEGLNQDNDSAEDRGSSINGRVDNQGGSISPNTSDSELDIFLRENRAANDRHREQWKSIPRPRDLEKAYNAGDTQAIEQWEQQWENFLQQLIPMDLPVIDGTITTASRNKAVKMVQTPRGYKVDKESSAYKAFDYIEKSLKKRKRQLERNLTEEERRTIDIVKRGLRGELNNTRLRAVSETFDSQLQQQIDGTLPAGHIYNLGMPGAILRSAGLPNLPIELAASRLTDKSMQENHPFDIAEVRGLVDAIQDPLAIFRSATHIGSFVVLTEIQHGGRNFVVAIEANRRQGRIEVNSIRSVYPKNNKQVANWIEDGLLEYAHKERMSEWFSKQQSNSADVRKLFRHTAKIVQNFENPKLPDTRFRVANHNQAIFVSNARQAVENIRQDRATPEQWLAMLQNSGGIKAGEDRWLGLSDWLKNYSPSVSRSDIGKVAESRGGSNTITRQQILDFINSNAIRIEEVHYSQFGEALIDQAIRSLESELRQIGWDAMQEKYPGIEELFEYDGRELLWSENLASIGEYEDFILDNNITGANPNHKAINETREQYTTPGLTDNHEIALTIPGIEPYNEYDDVHFGDAGGGRAIAWIRFGDTTDTDGNNVLVIDEIQSKRHQDGREKGYRDADAKAKLDNAVNTYRTATQEHDNYRNQLKEKYDYVSFAGSLYDKGVQFLNSLTEEERATLDDLVTKQRKAADELDKARATNHLVPDAPFDKNWHELAFKRMLRYAAENGYEHLAWTTGTQQAERYNIGNTISDIYRSYSNIIVGTQAGDIYIDFDSEGNITTGQFSGNTLAEVFGKGTADKILNTTPGQTLSGDNLHIGGEGMKAFYDRMIPSFVSKYVKKWGSKVQDITLPDLGDNGLTMHSVEITPDMRESVMQGQTMFRSVDNYTVTEDIKRIVGISSLVRPSYYASGTTDNGETWQIRISNHPAQFGNIIEHIDDENPMPQYFTSIVITDNPDVTTRGKQQLIEQQQQYNYDPQYQDILLDQLIIDTRTLNSDNYQDFLDEFSTHFDIFRHTGRSYFNDDYGTRFRSVPAIRRDAPPVRNENQTGNITPSMPDFRTIRPNESITDYAGQIILRTANYNNKLPGSHLRFRMTHRTEATVSGWINQRTDLNPTQRQAIIRYIDTLDGTAMQLATARWFTLGTIRIPDDITRVRQAMQVAHKAKVDPLTYDYPMAILNQFPNLQPSTQPINPDDLPTLNNKQSLPHGITIYNVDETPQAQQHIRDIIDTHLGTRTNPWCITSAINGRLTDEARNFWKAYNAHPKRVAFRDGRIIAFFAADIPIPIWWDTQDRPHSGIPIAPLTEYNEQNNTIDTYNPDGTILNSTPAEQNENEKPKTPNAPSSTNNVGTVANKREQSELVQSLPSESNLGDSHIAPPVRDTATQESTHTIADATIAHIEQIGDDYTRYIDNIAEQVSQALTPQPTDDARTLAEKAILRFRFTDDTNTSPLAGRDAPPVREEISMGSVSPEEQSIIDNAKTNGTYLLAPNGRPTNLSPRQWVQVRTRAFKEWFGDWLKQARVNKLKASKPINIVFNNQYDLNRDSAKQWMKDNIRGEYTNKDTGETIQISRVGINEVTSHGTKDDAHLISITAIPQLIEDSIFIEEIPNEKGNDKYDSYRYYVCGAKINGDDYTIKVVIGVKGDSKYYDHRLTQIEKGILIDNLNGLSNSVAENQNASNSMGKDSKLLSILQTNASKIVDENGEPRVMYHGTGSDFTTFDMQDGSLGRGAYFTSNWDEAAEYAKQKQNAEDIDDLDESMVLEVFLNVRDDNNITHSRFYREDIEVLATSPNQIKSATDNIGTFDNRLNDIRFRSVKDGEFLNRNNLTPEEFSRLTNSIANAMDTNDHNHRMTWFTERHFDSMQRLANLISDIPGTNPDSQYSPWITQNQAKSRAQAAICH